MGVLLAPHVTEKTSQGLQERNQYAFRVRRDATRTDVRRRSS
jgi:ribosomal protein L23